MAEGTAEAGMDRRVEPEAELGEATSPAVARDLFRGGVVRPTCGISKGYAQANMIALPREYAYDFLLFAQRNPKPCPILDVLDPGSPTPSIAAGSDIRTDIPLYRVWENGELVDALPDITDVWARHDDLVTFLIGCSFTFEFPLMEAGIPVRHILAGRNVPMYNTSIACRPAGRFSANMVVSMRGIQPDRIADAVQRLRLLSKRARRTCRGRLARTHRHHGSHASRLRRRAGARGRRRSRVLGMRRHPAGRGDGVQADVRDHARARPHVHH